VRFPFLGLGLYRTMTENGSDIRIEQRINGCIGVRGRFVVVAPFKKGGGTPMDLIQSADQGAQIAILRCVPGGKVSVNGPEEIPSCPVAAKAPKCSHPCMNMRVDQTRQNNHVACIHDVRIFCTEPLSYVADTIILYQ